MNLASSFESFAQRIRGVWPGLVVSVMVASAAHFLSEHYGAPLMLFALLLGMSLGFLSGEDSSREGIAFSSRVVLRIGVALLGCRITAEQVVSLGMEPVILVVASVATTIAMAMMLARLMGFNVLFGLLSGGATAICGASAALAISAALPNHSGKERATLFTVISVSALSTIAMVFYPMVVQWFDLDAQRAGVFLGATIHDVAQVVGAGYSLSRETGDTATVVKLMRVAMLLPVIAVTVFVSRFVTRFSGETCDAGKKPPILPGFAVAFLVLVTANSLGLIPAWGQQLGGQLSSWCLVVAIAAIGMKTQLRDLMAVGVRPIVLMLTETMFLAVFVLLFIRGYN